MNKPDIDTGLYRIKDSLDAIMWYMNEYPDDVQIIPNFFLDKLYKLHELIAQHSKELGSNVFNK